MLDVSPPALPLPHCHLSQALLLKRRIPYRQHPSLRSGQALVHQQDLRLQVGSHSKGQAHVHATGIALHRRVNELLHTGKVHDLVELAINPSASSGQVSARFIPRPVLSLSKG
jgi:hypothetical protein